MKQNYSDVDINLLKILLKIYIVCCLYCPSGGVYFFTTLLKLQT